MQELKADFVVPLGMLAMFLGSVREEELAPSVAGAASCSGSVNTSRRAGRTLCRCIKPYKSAGHIIRSSRLILRNIFITKSLCNILTPLVSRRFKDERVHRR